VKTTVSIDFQAVVSCFLGDHLNSVGGYTTSCYSSSNQCSSLFESGPTRSRPHPTADLFSLYNLNSLAVSVARTDPVTGEKRKLRKSYKGKLTAYDLPGRNEPVRHEPGTPGGLLSLLDFPDEEWHIQKVAGGKEVRSTLPESIQSRLTKAMTMEKGDIPGFDASILGLDIPPPYTSQQHSQQSSLKRSSSMAFGGVDIKPSLSPLPTSLPSTQLNGSTGIAAQQATSNSPYPLVQQTTDDNLARPRRAGKKRRYDDESFEGYGEGFVDDDRGGASGAGAGGGGNYSSGGEFDERRVNGKKKRRKVRHFSNNSAVSFIQTLFILGTLANQCSNQLDGRFHCQPSKFRVG
jgi:hypothetical protein